MQTNHFNSYKKLCQIILASALLCNVSAYAEPGNTNNEDAKAGVEAPTMTTFTGAAVKGEGAKETKPTVLFVCGGNTGRSVIAEWYMRAKYGDNVDTFSRGSGIAPGDEVTTEAPAAALIVAKGNATKKQMASRRATPASITDIYNANIVLAMTSSHKTRLIAMIDRECNPANLDTRGLDEETRVKWNNMCANNAEVLKNKIHTLIGCATGTDGDIPDGYKQPDSAYNAIRRDIVYYTKTIMDNTANPSINTYQAPSHGKLGMSYHPNPYENIYCKPVK